MGRFATGQSTISDKTNSRFPFDPNLSRLRSNPVESFFRCLSELILKNIVTGDQVTRWIYGTSLDESGVARTDLFRAKLYPESDDDTDPLDDGIDGEFERIEYAYNRQAQVTRLTDPNGTVHEYDLDRLGRLTEKAPLRVSQKFLTK